MYYSEEIPAFLEGLQEKWRSSGGIDQSELKRLVELLINGSGGKMSFLDLCFFYFVWFWCEDEPEPEDDLMLHITIQIDTEEHLVD